MDEQIARFRSRVAALSRQRRGERYPSDIRKEAVALAQTLRRAGTSQARVSELLGIRWVTLKRWSGTDESAFARVVVERRSVEHPPSSVAITSPDGWRIEGLNFDQATALLRRLR